ncbi:glycoside hydrolase family 99-like domain-containing protein [Pedobacter sp. SD-b]|uniref:Glycoside hydrolase family 99-like domain-containing protein n=1 Tax=Pedobacter segetis TaxID=2793069 RepID=A0ABS1BGS3_9SPHI|nr:glycoside hydrolase family 99-like domain-containing protein [Pedobacter segetis]MBK0382069.1 glycoside hydrolase family 99-like domain-containing protein [Pedobacter segetis]
MHNIKPIAIYLPQFHPFEENDKWWGKGFTEWNNVVKAKPLFRNHYQPHLPSDLGFYDLRLKTTHTDQINLAKTYGIEGFCYYHYWFNGKRLMDKALNIVLENDLEFPFMLCWANENWTRRWDGQDKEILIEQNYSEDDDLKHMNYLCESFFKHKNYILVNGKPVFVVYRPMLFPNIKSTIKLWRGIAQKHGFEDLHLIMVNAHQAEYSPKELGFDAVMDFQPQFKQAKRIIPNRINIKLHNLNIKKTPYWEHIICDYQQFSEEAYHTFKEKQSLGNINPCITPMWDNAARRKSGGFILKGSTPKLYEKWLSKIIADIKDRRGEDNFLFINAWNEWAEGNHLEPCQQWGKHYLEATKSAVVNA